MFKKSRLMLYFAVAMALVLSLGLLGSAGVAKADSGDEEQAGPGRRIVAAALMRDLIRVTVDQTSLTRRDILKGFRDDQTLKEQIEKVGGNVNAIKETVKADAIKRIDEAVAAKKITKEQGDLAKSKLDEALDKLLTTVPKLRNLRRPGPRFSN